MTISTLLLLAASVQADPDRIEVTPSRLMMDPGVTTTATAQAFRNDGTVIQDVTITWRSLNSTVATIDADGMVLAISPGETRITARVGNTMGFAAVVVRPRPAATIAIDLPVSNLSAGTSAPLSVSVYDTDGNAVSSPPVTFISSNANVAHVDRTGRVFARDPGTATITATSDSISASLTVTTSDVALGAARLTSSTSRARTGDVVRFRIETDNPEATPQYPAWSVDGAGARIVAEGDNGVFVAERPGTYRITALIGESPALTTLIEVSPRIDEAELVKVGRGAAADHHSGDTWVFEGADGRDYAYIGTFMYDWMKVWDVTDPQAPVLTDSLQLDARRINDVKIHQSNRIGILTREGASDRRNGIVILDLSEPAHPEIISEYKRTVPGGVHNVWVEGDLIYAVHNGTRDIHIIDISDPTEPDEVGRWGLPESPTKSLHDVIVQDGYAYLSYWDDGAVTLDVGAGTHGGTPTEPQFVSRYKYPAGNTHTAWRAGRYLFVGDEIFPEEWDADSPIEARGYIHVLDMADPNNPVDVAKYEVPEAGAHNIWVEGDRLYVGYYQAGLRVVDISGELRGDLYRQGREIAVLKTTDAESTVPNWGMTWGAQIHKGHIFTSDLNSGLWVVKLIEGQRTIS